MKILISGHAKFEAKRREISMKTIMDIALTPQQKIKTASGRIICQSRMHDPATNQEKLFRVIVKDAKEIRTVITVYKTSKIAKYWQTEK